MEHIHVSAFKIVWECILKLKYIFKFILVPSPGRSDWPLFCRNVTGSHEDVVWSLWHQFNDVSDFFMVLFPGLLGAFDQHRQRGESGRPGIHVHAELHLGKCTSRRLPLCAAGYILRREETRPVCRDLMWCASSLKRNMDLQSVGNLEWTWMQRHSGSHYIVFKAWSATVLDCCSRAMGITKVVFTEGFQHLGCRSSSSYIYIHNLFVDSMQVDKAWFPHSVHSGQ